MRVHMFAASRLWGACLVALAGTVGASLGACSSQDSADAVEPGAVLPPSGQALGGSATSKGVPPLPSADPNPLGLPPRPLTLLPGDRVFAVAGRMLPGAKVGSTLRLEPAAVLENLAETLLLQPPDGRVYKLHPAYALPVPPTYTPRPLDPLVVAWGGELKHAVVTKVVKDRALARLLDLDSRLPEQLLPKGGPALRQTPGLHPGNYALWEAAPGEHHHVLLVSAVERQPPCWFVLDYGGAARLVESAQLRTLPLSLNGLRPGADVLAESLGRLLPAKVVSLDLPGFVQVRFERAGAPVWLGAGKVRPPLGTKPD